LISSDKASPVKSSNRLFKNPSKPFGESRKKKANQLKSKADYNGVEMSKYDAEKWVRKAGKFLNSAQESLEQ